MTSNSAKMKEKYGKTPDFKEIALKAGYSVTDAEVFMYKHTHPIVMETYITKEIPDSYLNKLFIYWIEQCTTPKKLDSSPFIRVNTIFKHRLTLSNWRDKLKGLISLLKPNKQL